MGIGGYTIIYLVGLVVIWAYAARIVLEEPTAHGQGILAPIGCLVGFLWPLALAYLLFFGLPMLAITKWRER